MSDVLIHDLPDEVVAALDAQACGEGLSRSEFLRRLLTRAARPLQPEATMADLEWFAETFADLRDPEIMDAMWQ